jgi:hypothetical protein
MEATKYGVTMRVMAGEALDIASVIRTRTRTLFENV